MGKLEQSVERKSHSAANEHPQVTANGPGTPGAPASAVAAHTTRIGWVKPVMKKRVA